MILMDDLAGHRCITLQYNDKSFMQSSDNMIGTVAIQSFLEEYRLLGYDAV
jgi:hypothetical protein